MSRKKSELTEKVNGNLNRYNATRLQAVKDEHQLTADGSDNAAIGLALDAYDRGTVDVDEEIILGLLGYGEKEIATLPLAEQEKRTHERQDIETALRMPNVDMWTLLRPGLIREARRQTTLSQKLATVDFDAQDKTGRGRKNRVPGSAELRVEEAVQRLMEANAIATPEMVVFLTRSIIMNEADVHWDYVVNYTNKHQGEIDAYNVGNGFHSQRQGIAHNRRRALLLKKQGKNGAQGAS